MRIVYAAFTGFGALRVLEVERETITPATLDSRWIMRIAEVRC